MHTQEGLGEVGRLLQGNVILGGRAGPERAQRLARAEVFRCQTVLSTCCFRYGLWAAWTDPVAGESCSLQTRECLHLRHRGDMEASWSVSTRLPCGRKEHSVALAPSGVPVSHRWDLCKSPQTWPGRTSWSHGCVRKASRDGARTLGRRVSGEWGWGPESGLARVSDTPLWALNVLWRKLRGMLPMWGVRVLPLRATLTHICESYQEGPLGSGEGWVNAA